MNHQINKPAVFRLMKNIFNDENVFRGFLFEFFDDYLNLQYPYSEGLMVKIQGLINYCERHGRLNKLLN